MMKRNTRSDIVRIGTDLISRQGFNATGVDTVLKEAGIPKGSFYHFFKSKEDFGLAVINHFAERYDQRLITFLADEEVTPLNRIRNYLESGLMRLEQNLCAKGCLIGNLGQELADSNERFRSRLDEIFNSWKGHFSVCLREAQKRGELSAEVDPDALACFILSGWEGSILRAKVMKSPQPVRDFIQVLFSTALQRI
jgi:TetR/AcrR family transcriptional repressor of nem operon